MKYLQPLVFVASLSMAGGSAFVLAYGGIMAVEVAANYEIQHIQMKRIIDAPGRPSQTGKK